jgi:hypothetical protein
MNRGFRRVSVTLLSMGVSGAALAVLMTGSSFRMPVGVLDGGGTSAASANHRLSAASGEPATGTAASGSYRMTTGFMAQKLKAAPGGKTSISSVVNPSVDTVLALQPSFGTLTLEIPAGTFAETVTLNLRVPSGFPAPNSNIGSFKGTSVGVEIETDKGLQPRRPLTLTLRYRDRDVQGMTESRLRVARFINLEGRWLPLATAVDEAGNSLTARLDHLSTFRVVEWVPAASLGSAFVYPNPLRPSLGHAQMNITNLPADATVSIFTLAGDLVRELTADDTGRAVWDGKDRDGQDAATGVYLALTRHGHDAKTVKIAVQR